MMNGTVCCNQKSLLMSISSLVRGGMVPCEAAKTIRASFETALTAFGAARGGIFLLQHHDVPMRLQALCTFGLPEPLVEAIESRHDVHEMAAVHIWQMVSKLAGGHAVHHLESAAEPSVEVLQDDHAYCAPVLDLVLNVPVAIMYVEKEHDDDPESKAITQSWMTTYALTLGQIVQVGFPPPKFEEEEPGQNKIKALENAPELIGASLETQLLRNELHEIYIPAASAPDPDPILILGEKGTGKDLVARYIYAYSDRRSRPYVVVNCAEITDELAAARFFGHKKGSFTGSLANEPGLFRAADRGVLFLDEIVELSLKAQGTLLRVLESRTVVPLGETREQRVDVQVILGTNRDPEEATRQGLMRPDLLDRFRTQAIRLAPLRDRPWDIPLLVRHFIAYHEDRTKKKIQALHPSVLKTMTGYSWPGNVRELARVCSLLITHVKSGAAIDDALLRRVVPHVVKAECNPKAGGMLAGDLPMREAMEVFGRELILARLRQHNWNVKSARESLGLPKTTFHRYTRSLGIASVVRGETAELEFQYPAKAFSVGPAATVS